ncbi:MAG: YceI family protein [Chitinophagaceae bacterium]
MKRILTTFIFSSLTVLVFAQTYKPVDEGSKVKFVIKNFGINTGGTFNGLDGTIVFDPANPANASFDVNVDAKTIDTDVESRDNHLRKEEYFDVEKFPTLNFKSTKVTKTNSSDFLYMFGNITIKGVSKEIKFPFKATPKDDGYIFEGNFKLNRRDFGVGGSSLSLSDELTVTLSVFAKKN